MKGVIVVCLKELVTTKFGEDVWKKCLVDVGVNPNTTFLHSADVDDGTVVGVLQAVCKNLNITLEQAAEAFGDYWVNEFSQKIYKSFYNKHKSAKEFLLSMDNVHDIITKTMENAKPPKFGYENKDENTLIMHYNSHRGLIDIMIGLIKGVGKFYNEKLTVTKIGNEKVEIKFS